MNKREKKLVADMEKALNTIPYPYRLKMVHRVDCDDFDEVLPESSGWYAWMYTATEVRPINHDYHIMPLITDAVAKKYHVDVEKCFELVECSY